MTARHVISIDDHRLRRRLAKLAAAGSKHLARAVEASTIVFQNDLKERLNRMGTGHLRGGSRPHRASAPGEPPAPDTSNYRDSWQVSFESGGMTGMVATNLEYGLHLEYGTERMEPRPHVGPQVLEHTPKHLRYMREALKAAAREAERP